ncbi:MAG: DegT/DnrJ/EryC1/StrS family aminotransferase [Myxococcota bacterium]|nr:DegT/DnrJ/EryC1/StrS family aminotransferase [Myxococcota bacterium]
MSDHRSAVAALVEAHLAVDPMRPPRPGTLPLAMPTFGAEEVAEAIDSLLTGWVTMGRKVEEFEQAWAEYVGTGHAVMVNSGSSALLVMLSALVETGRLSRGDEVLVPAVSWSTDLFAVAQAGLVPVLIDVDPESLCVEGHHDRPLLAVHLLGAASRATAPLLLEDACGAHGARVGDTNVGARGFAGVFSFFFSHTLSTVEGGMITTNDAVFADALRGLRAHGWVRERTDRAAIEAAHPEIDPRFLFASPGYNLRPTDLAGAFGIHQVPRLDGFVARRRQNHAAWCAAIDALGLPLRTYPELPGTTHSAFAFPMLVDADSPLDRVTLCERLEAHGVTTRPISGSNLARQPAFTRVPGARIEGPLTVADAVHERGFFVGNSHAFGPVQGGVLVDALRAAFGR